MHREKHITSYIYIYIYIYIYVDIYTSKLLHISRTNGDNIIYKSHTYRAIITSLDQLRGILLTPILPEIFPLAIYSETCLEQPRLESVRVICMEIWFCTVRIRKIAVSHSRWSDILVSVKPVFIHPVSDGLFMPFLSRPSYFFITLSPLMSSHSRQLNSHFTFLLSAPTPLFRSSNPIPIICPIIGRRSRYIGGATPEVTSNLRHKQTSRPFIMAAAAVHHVTTTSTITARARGSKWLKGKRRYGDYIISANDNQATSCLLTAITI